MQTRTNLRSGDGGYPGGSYTQTCDTITYDSGTGILKAVCLQNNGARNWSELYLSDTMNNIDDIINCDGILAMITARQD